MTPHMNATPRHAVYWAPEPAHPLWQAGIAWLGRDPMAPSPHLPSPVHEATSEPRRYGFHATLKPPMALREGASVDDFLAAVQAIARRTPRFAMPRLRVDTLGDFIALRPADGEPGNAHPLRRLADDCVRCLDHWRAPPGAATLRRRRQSRVLTPRQDALLQRWGYPHVFDQWRFHLTLTDALPSGPAGDVLRQQLADAAARHFASALAAPLACYSLCVFTEPEPGEPFVLAHRVALMA